MDNLIYYGSLGGNSTGSNRKISRLGIFHYCDSSSLSGSGVHDVYIPAGWKLLYASVEARDNVKYQDTKVWLKYMQGDNYARINYLDLQSGATAFQVIIVAYKE